MSRSISSRSVWSPPDQKPDGSVGTQQSFGWDIVNSKAIDPSSLAIPDNLAPVISITSQTLTTDTGVSATDLLTNDGQVTLTGTATDNLSVVSVHIFDGSTDLGAATLNGSDWTFSTLLTTGAHSLNAVATDANGNSTATTMQAQIIVDTTGPIVSITSQILAHDTGVLPNDLVTSDGHVSLTGLASDDHALLNVHIFDGTTDLGAATLNGTTWSFDSVLGVGKHSLTAVATDYANNTSSTPIQPQITVVAFDPIVGQLGQTHVNGTSGDDNIIFGTTNVFVNAGRGNDTISIFADSTSHFHVLNGGSGSDTLDLSALTTANSVNLDSMFANGQQLGSAFLNSIENVIGGHANDIITGNNSSNILTGGDGSDTFTFGSIGAVRNGPTLNPAARDIITDFHATSEVASLHDTINFGRIDAVQGGRDNAFSLNTTAWDGTGAEFTAAGQLRYQFLIDSKGQEHTIIAGNVNNAGEGNGLSADFEIDLLGHHLLSGSDFIL
jgi:Ca2+-binding RTX toxin-like protein